MGNGFVVYVGDVESTGLDPKSNEIIELCLLRLVEKNGIYVEDDCKVWYFLCTNPSSIQEQALQVNGFLRNEILGLTQSGRDKFKPAKEVLPLIIDWISDDNVSSLDRVFVGQNPTFDLEMMKEMWKRNGFPNDDEFIFSVERNNRTLDTKAIVALFDLCTGRRRKAFSLGQLVKSIGVKKEQAHTSEGDVRMTASLLLKCLNMIKPVVEKEFKDCYSKEDVE